MIYSFYKDRFGKKVSIILTVITYVLIVALTLYASFEPQAELKYRAL